MMFPPGENASELTELKDPTDSSEGSAANGDRSHCRIVPSSVPTAKVAPFGDIAMELKPKNPRILTALLDSRYRSVTGPFPDTVTRMEPSGEYASNEIPGLRTSSVATRSRVSTFQ